MNRRIASLTGTLVGGLALALMLLLAIPTRPTLADSMVTHVGNHGDVVTNIAHFSGMLDTGADDAVFTAGEEMTYTIYLPAVVKNHAPPVYLRTNIDNIFTFLDTCPQNDPAIATIRDDFIIRVNGAVVGEVPCTEPYSEIPIEQNSDELTYLQTLRTVYYMDAGVPDHLPWTSMSLYDWMASNIDGINIKEGVYGGYCCDTIEGRKYMVAGTATEATLDWRRTWNGMSSLIDFIAHEVRHADGGPGHVSGCEAFPDYAGCDASYDLNNLGSYGVQYWLNEAWMSAYLHIGIGCADEYTAQSTVASHMNTCNVQFRRRFVDPPPLLEMPDPPYGGPCYGP